MASAGNENLSHEVGSKDQKRRNTIEAPIEYAASASHAASRAAVIAGAAVAGPGEATIAS